MSFRDLSINSIQTFEADVFDKATLLQTLNLIKNKLFFLEDELLRSNAKLEELTLGDNQLNKIPEQVGFMKNLQQLSLQRNMISSITSQTFANLTDLEYLLLNDNRLITIPDKAFLRLRKLKILSMNEGEIGSLAFKEKNGSVRCRIQFGVGESEDEYIQLDDIEENMKGVLRSALQQSGFARILTDSSLKFLPCSRWNVC
ncbi:hypothetical protein OS493_031344 [Desmophyllum pertusum]|uniref:Uncharacterized protein n=1 Tax=Desmophyllum pertusum TaxID=174260 RepID=A0A9W9YW69_9CNID|nr:hypothetical protein OS493_031344 [Desmophyllum pertusum]